MAATRTLTYINTPASFGVEVAETDEEGEVHTHQLANPRDTMTLLFALKGEGGWLPATTVANAERFMTKPPQTQRQWEQAVAAWLEEGTDA